MRDFLPDEVRRREYVIGIIADVYRRYGFEPLETPAIENIDTLMGKYGEEGNKLIFKILRRGDQEASGVADLALRYDLTVPLARVVAEHRGQLPRVLKCYQIQPVWRADRPARGRFREFYQCDLDTIGSRSMVVEVELCSAISDVLVALGFSRFTIRLNHREVLRGILDICGVPAALHTTALVALDKLDKIGREDVERELLERELSKPSARALVQWFDALGHAGHEGATFNAELVARLEKALVKHPAALKGAHEVAQIIKWAEATSAGSHLQVDASLARGLSYYTGAIMEVNVADLAGSLGGGGRYDNLIGMFLDEHVPACGFSLGLERILVVMSERGMFPAHVQKASAEVLVTVFEEGVADSLALASMLRAQGISVDVYPSQDKIGKQLKYGSERQIRWVAIVGEDELATGGVSVRDLQTGSQVTVPREQVVAYLQGNGPPPIVERGQRRILLRGEHE